MSVLHVAADDRTGALETAGACAQAGLPAAVVVAGHGGAPPARVQAVVTDLGTRHLDGPRAGEVAAAERPAGHAVHKIDSTLRGAWAHELVARHRDTGWRVLVVPAFPAAGRTCHGGTVLVDGRPVAQVWSDVRGAVASSRPDEHLRAAGAGDVAGLLDADDLADWLVGGAPFAVCDALTDGDLAAVARAWVRRPGVLLAGTAATAGAAAAALAGPSPVPPPPVVEGPVLVVCGSLHPAARAQVRHLLAAGAVAVEAAQDVREGHTSVLATRVPENHEVTAAAAEEAASALAERARALLAAGAWGTVVVVGGDTAAAVLGPEPRVVGGLLQPGVPWCPAVGDGPLVLAKPGGFGSPDLLTVLTSARMQA